MRQWFLRMPGLIVLLNGVFVVLIPGVLFPICESAHLGWTQGYQPSMRCFWYGQAEILLGLCVCVAGLGLCFRPTRDCGFAVGLMLLPVAAWLVLAPGDGTALAFAALGDGYTSLWGAGGASLGNALVISSYLAIGLGFLGSPQVFVRFIAIYTVFMTVVYSAISYKTPWCMLGFLQGMILLAGVGVAIILRLCCCVPVRSLVILIVAAGCVHLA